MKIDLFRALSPIGAAASALSLLLSAGAQAQVAPARDSDRDGVPDDIDAAPCDPTVSARQFVPADRTYGMLMFEDLWPIRGDFDFNDAVIAYNQVLLYDSSALLTGIRMELSVMAVGAGYSNGLAFRLPGVPRTNVTFLSSTIGNVPNGEKANVRLDPNEAEAVIILTGDLHALFGLPGGTMINTEADRAPHPYVDIVLEVRFAPGVNLSPADAPYDIFLFNRERGIEVHRPQYGGTSSMNHALFNTGDDGSTSTRRFVTRQGIPFALDLPELANYPLESAPIDLLYPGIVDFGRTAGRDGTDFYRHPVIDTAYGIVPPRPLLGQTAPDLSCLAPEPGVCGEASGTGSVNVPEAELCEQGVPSGVDESGGMWRWTCTGEVGEPTECTAPRLWCTPHLPYVCEVPGGIGLQWCNGSGTGLSSCSALVCGPGFYLSDGSCLPQVCNPGIIRSCDVEHGAGRQVCDNKGTSWGACEVVSCEPGYTREGNACVPVPAGVTKWSAGTEAWPDQACNFLLSFGFCNTNNRSHANAWATEVCQNNGYSWGEWTGRKLPGCSGDVSMWCNGEIPCDPIYEYRCNVFDQTRVEVRCHP